MLMVTKALVIVAVIAAVAAAALSTPNAPAGGRARPAHVR
jgi:hypothetical protein